MLQVINHGSPSGGDGGEDSQQEEEEEEERETNEHAAVPAEASSSPPPPLPPPPLLPSPLPSSFAEVNPWYFKKDKLSGKYFYYKKNIMFPTGWETTWIKPTSEVECSSSSSMMNEDSTATTSEFF